MKLTSENLETLAAKAYLNSKCLSREEFLEDLGKTKIIKKLAKKISIGSSKNLRLLTNHIISFTNVFDINFAKMVLLDGVTEKQEKVIRTVLLYLGFLHKHEYTATLLDYETIKLLKEMD